MSAAIVIKKSDFKEEQVINLTGSKSESNRALILSALSQGKVMINNLSSAADTVTLNKILTQDRESKSDKKVINVGPAGTAMRFLTAYFSFKGEQVEITGSDRMKQRPIGTLVNALTNLGADLSYLETDGFPPVFINGPFEQKNLRVAIRGDISSQFLTALLLLASSLPKGLELEIIDELTSKPYVDMTLAMLAQCGINHTWENDIISIQPQEFRPTTLTIEPDWSAASYWYSVAALAENAKIHLPNLKKDSLQGDSAVAGIMTLFGVHTTFEQDGIVIEKIHQEIKPQLLDFRECPDLAQTVIVCAAILGKEFSFTGLETLKIKETDRIFALQTELAKIGVKLIETQADIYQLDCLDMVIPEEISITTYEDHRMAMAFAPLAMIIGEVKIEESQVVEKSYPHFWEDFKKIGFSIK
ncbi:3-phosphoshikimate 1-carboxyvinyltransferase [Pedobacter cryophilus]|uniref:3-phosphoshikimate 1-carboxyvinyltransferase n=1 Tax=Pedobacter cryophilus TaxID=2571271 RepID=A0A4U1C3Y2_9SPHI|nr:3-phosphoshikimate 1-carboxyvinyltransferase [Pedobacter cryophilus]TKB97924.1 3-phosphoshikimate 1-carboxyvinyltransferase [Pedobacter cryophilus]